MYGEEHAHKQREETLNAMRANLAQDGCAGQANAAMPVREGMRERFRSRLDRARSEGNKAAQLGELVCLLDDNPDLARILELIDALGGEY